METKICANCKIEKAVSEFVKKRGKPTVCLLCGRKRAKQWRAENPEKAKATDRRKSLKQNYGITMEDFDAILAEQDYRCAICRTTDPKGRGQFSVDHDHDTGQVRGLLCYRCNNALGTFGDNIAGIMKVVSYLKRSSIKASSEGSS